MPGTVILPIPTPPANGDASPPASLLSGSSRGKIKLAIEEQNKAPVATHMRTIGIIYPPPDIRSIVDKIVQVVAKNGPINNSSNAKFNFFNPSNPYHAYYQPCLSEARAETNSAAQQPPSQPTDSNALGFESSAPAADHSEAASKPDAAVQFRLPSRKVLEPPEAEQYTVT